MLCSPPSLSFCIRTHACSPTSSNEPTSPTPPSLSQPISNSSLPPQLNPHSLLTTLPITLLYSLPPPLPLPLHLRLFLFVSLKFTLLFGRFLASVAERTEYLFFISTYNIRMKFVLILLTLDVLSMKNYQ